ncbi:lectin [Guyanagaster necrorhizus]|uniref:Lectin n=1 Tax=Guyanagaster necrorhizus TaxID=856835 RepID=A0A9P8AQI8_9AGAR|nr:lectin [Guyanagaster necrorhizus MCA 3950]KAG7443901.1 lectin [Guyanagaster necrorhizus MCA 3950]
MLVHASIALSLIPVLLSAISTTALPTTEPSLAVATSLVARAEIQPLTFTDSNWIWTGETASPGGDAPDGSRPFRLTIPHTSTKCPVCATIIIIADNRYTLYANGAEVGSGIAYEGTSSTSQVYTVGLNPEIDNVIAVNATNTGGPAGLIATLLVDYLDGTTETFVTDASWKTLKTPTVDGFENPSLDDSAWIAANVQGPAGMAPWGAISLPPALDLTQSDWIWTNETDSAGNAPIGSRAFRKTIISPYGKGAVCAKVVMTTDNAYTLYANGQSIGSGSDYTSAQAYSVPQLDPDENVFAVNGTNVAPGGPAGVIGTILVAYSDGTSASYITDNTWKAFIGVPSGFELPATDDDAWSDATVVAKYGGSPWGDITVPTA